jgi:hypothetical protein
LRKSLGRARWRDILGSLRRGENFRCHKTLEYNDDGDPFPGSGKLCAGGLEWQKKNKVPNQFLQICGRLGWE